MFRTVVAVAAIAIGITAVAAQSDPIAARKGLMKNMGAATKTGGQMVKGEAPYDQAKATGDLRDLYRCRGQDAGPVPGAIPRPAARPRRRRRSGKTRPASRPGSPRCRPRPSAAKASVKDLDSFKGAFGGLTKNCGGCHETYRVKKS